MSQYKFSKIFTATIVMIVFGLPQLAGASERSRNLQVANISVTYSDLNLASDHGLKVLYSRLSDASEAVCGEQYDARSAGSLKQLRKNKQCFHAAMAKAVERFNHTNLRQFHTQNR